MKFNNLLIVIALIITILFLTACKGDDTSATSSEISTPSTSSEISKPDTSQPTVSLPDEESEPETSSTPVTSKPIQKPIETPKKTASELIIGKWKTEMDITEYLSIMNYEVDAEVKITIISEFKADGTYTEQADEAIFKAALQDAVGNADLYDTFKEDFENSGSYKFDDEILSMQYSDEPDFTVVEYNFVNDNTFKLLTLSDEIKYSRI